jgi:hypothetical protein
MKTSKATNENTEEKRSCYKCQPGGTVQFVQSSSEQLSSYVQPKYITNFTKLTSACVKYSCILQHLQPHSSILHTLLNLLQTFYMIPQQRLQHAESLQYKGRLSSPTVFTSFTASWICTVLKFKLFSNKWSFHTICHSCVLRDYYITRFGYNQCYGALFNLPILEILCSYFKPETC